MPLDQSLFNSLLSPRETALAQTSEAKSILLSDISAQKREKMLAPVTNALAQLPLTPIADQTTKSVINSLAQEPLKDIAIEAELRKQMYPESYTRTIKPEHLDEALIRGGKEYLMSVPQTAIGLAAITGAAAETAFGTGGLATDLKNSAVEKYIKFQKDIQKDARPEDSVIYSYDQAQKGNFGALASWAAHGLGNVTTQLATILLGAGLIQKGVEITGKRAVVSLMGNIVEKEAAKIAAATTEKVITEAITQQATAAVTRKIAEATGMTAMAASLEGGEIGMGLAEQSVKRGTPLTGAEVGRGLAATAAATGVEYLGLDLFKKALKGKLGSIGDGPGIADGVAGIPGKLARGAVATAKVGPAESFQEGLQTGIEQWGQGKNPLDPKQRPEQIEGAAIGLLMGVPGGVGASFHGSTEERKSSEIKAVGKRLIEAEAQPGFTEKVRTAVETKNADQYMDSGSKEFNPVVGVKALAALNRDESTSPADKHAHYNTAVRTYNDLKNRQLAWLDKAEDPKDPTTAKQADAAMEILKGIQDRMLPEIQTMGVTGTTSPELKKLLAEANDDVIVEKALTQILGSRGTGDIGGFIDTEAIINNPAIGTDTKNLVQQVKSLTDSQKVLVERANRTTEDVTENVFAGTDGQKGINDYIAAIQTATGDGNTEQAQKELDNLAEYMQGKQTRAVTFRNLLKEAMTPKEEKSKADYKSPVTPEDLQNLETYNKERLIRKQSPYSIGPKFEPTVQAMELEADALEKALTLGSAISKLTPTTPVIVSQTSITSPAVTELTGNKEELATTQVVESGTETAKELTPQAQKTIKMFGEMDIEKLKNILKTVKPGSTTHTLAKKEITKRESLNTSTQITPSEVTSSITPQTSAQMTDADTAIQASVSSQTQTKTEIPTKETPNAQTDKTDTTTPVSRASEVTPTDQAGREGSESNVSTEVINGVTTPEQRIEEANEAFFSASLDHTFEVMDQEIAGEVKEEVSKTETTSPPSGNQKTLITPRDAVDTNTIRTGFKATKNKSFFQQATNFLKDLSHFIQTGDKEKDPDRIKLLADILEFTEKFTVAAKANFQYKDNEKFHYEDPLNWLADQGVLPEMVNTAISATVYKWLATRASETEINDEDDARGILSLKKSATLLPITEKLVSNIGTSSAVLANNLGKEILKVLGLKAGDKVQAQVQERVEISLGLSALATLQKMGYLQRILISADAMTKLAKANKDYDLDFTMTPAEFRARPKETDVKFFKIIPSSQTKAIKITYSQSKGTWDALFTGVRDKAEYSWRWIPPNTSDSQEKLRGSKQNASIGRTKNKNKNVKRPIQLAAEVMNVFESLNQETKEAILGVESLDGLHKNNVEGVESNNKNLLERVYPRVNAWLHNAGKQKDGLKSLFNIPAYFGGNTRMYQEGSINMLMNKSSQRYMYSMQEWQKTYDLVDEKSENFFNEEMYNFFIEAIGQSLKIESSKDLNFLDSTIKALKSPIMVEALVAIDVILKQFPDGSNFDQAVTAKIAETLTSAQMTAIANGVKEGKQNMHSLKGLIEYQRFINAQSNGDKTFTTDISFGMDGLASGATIALTQLTTSKMSPQLLGILLSAGYSFTDEVSPAERMAANDPYQAIGAIWGNELAKIEQELVDKIRTSKQQRDKDITLLKLRRIKAAESLLGPLYKKDGLLAEITRSLSKDRAVPALYGSGKDSLINGLLDTFVKEAIEKKLQSMAASDSNLLKQEFTDFRNNVRLITGNPNWGRIANKKDLLNLELTPAMLKELQSYFTLYHGKALQTAIGAIYGDIQKASKPLNQAIAIGVGYYNTAMDLLLTEHFKTHGEITVGELAAIKKKLQPLFPRIKTPHGDYVELAEFEQSKNYDKSDIQNIIQYYKDPKISLLTGRPHKIGKLANPGVSPVVTTTHIIDAAVAADVVGNDFGAGILNAHDNAIVGLHQIKAIHELMNKSFFKINNEYSMAEALQNSLIETKEAFIALGFHEMEGARKALDDNFAQLELKIAVKTKSGKTVYSTDTTDIVKGNNEAVANIIDVTKKSRDTILGAVTQINQYFVAGQNIKTGNIQQGKIEDITVTDIIPLAQAGVQAIANSNVQIENDVKVTLEEAQKALGSRLEPMSTEASDYAIQQTINKANVVETYDAIKQDSVFMDMPEHDAHLKGILNAIVANVMTPIELLRKTVLDDETHGQINTRDKKIYMASQVASPTPVSKALTHGIRMSTGEVYVHELVHAVTHVGLNANKYLRRQVETLFNIAEKELDKNGEGFRAFLNDPTIDIKDPANHYDVQAAKDRFARVFQGKSVTKRKYIEPVTKTEHTEELSSHLDEFVALGLTNANFVKALAGVSLVKHKQRLTAKSTWIGIIGDNLQDTLVNIFAKLLEILHEKLDRGINANNVGAELQRLAKLLTDIDSKNKTKFYNLTQAGLRRYGKFAGMANHMVKEVFKTTPVLKTAYYFKKGVSIAKESETPLGEFLRNVEYKYEKLDYGLIKSVVTEMQGHTPRMDWIHRLQHRRKNFLDAVKTEAIASTIRVANSTFHRELTPAEKVTFLKGAMKTGLSSLLDHMDITKIASLLNSKTTQQKEIDWILKEIQADKTLAPYTIYYKQSADALGYYMVHGRSRQGEHVIFSPKAIGHLINSSLYKGKLTTEQGDIATKLVDKLATIYALKYSSAKHLNTLSGLIAEDSEGITRLLKLHNELKQDSLQYAFNNNPFKMIKGYTKEILDPRIDYQLGTLADAKEMEKLGYTLSSKPIERDLLDPTRKVDIYAYTADTNRINDRLSMTASLASNKAKGANTQRLAQQMGETTQDGAINNQIIMQKKQAELDAMFFTYKKPLVQEGNPMIAQLDDTGEITGYRYMMSETTKDDYLGKTNEFDKVMGAMAGQIIDKARTPVINEELIDGLKAMYDKEYHNNPEAYVEVSPYAKDFKLREIYHLMPAAAKQYMEQKWGSPRMFVAKDVLTIAFGYRKYSLVQAFAKTPTERHILEKLVVEVANLVFRSYGLKVVNNAEQVAMFLTGIAKNNIVVKGLYVTLDNFGSNWIHLKTLGVPTQEIFTGSFEALQQGLKYQKDKQLLDDLKTKQKLMVDPQEIKRSELQIIRLKDMIARNPVTRFIEAGGLPTLVDDLDTDVTQSNYPNKLEQFVEKAANKLPTPVVNVGKVLFLTQDTGAYKLLNNAVKMTDFIARYVLYKKLMREAAAAPGFKGDQAAIDEAHSQTVIQVLEEFINFNLPTHQTIEYLNSIGVVWFSRYLLRVQKIIIKSMVNRPFDAVMAMMTANLLGFDQILNSLVGVNTNPFSRIDIPISVYSQNATEIITLTSMKDLLDM